MFFTKRLMFFSACNAVRRIFFESAFMQAKTKKVRRKVSLRRTLVILLRRLLFDKLPAVAYVHVALFGIGYFKPRKIVNACVVSLCLCRANACSVSVNLCH